MHGEHADSLAIDLDLMLSATSSTPKGILNSEFLGGWGAVIAPLSLDRISCLFNLLLSLLPCHNIMALNAISLALPGTKAWVVLITVPI